MLFGGSYVINRLYGQIITVIYLFGLFFIAFLFAENKAHKEPNLDVNKIKSGNKVKLASYSRPKISMSVRNEVFLKYQGRCAICHRTQKEAGATHQIDHILPYSLGGTDEIYNLQLLCQDCNLKKRDKW